MDITYHVYYSSEIDNQSHFFTRMEVKHCILYSKGKQCLRNSSLGNKLKELHFKHIINNIFHIVTIDMLLYT